MRRFSTVDKIKISVAVTSRSLFSPKKVHTYFPPDIQRNISDASQSYKLFVTVDSIKNWFNLSCSFLSSGTLLSHQQYFLLPFSRLRRSHYCNQDEQSGEERRQRRETTTRLMWAKAPLRPSFLLLLASLQAPLVSAEVLSRRKERNERSAATLAAPKSSPKRLRHCRTAEFGKEQIHGVALTSNSTKACQFCEW